MECHFQLEGAPDTSLRPALQRKPSSSRAAVHISTAHRSTAHHSNTLNFPLVSPRWPSLLDGVDWSVARFGSKQCSADVRRAPNSLHRHISTPQGTQKLCICIPAQTHRLIQDTKKPGAEDLRIKIGLLSTALGSNKGATNPLPQSPQILGYVTISPAGVIC